MTAAQRFLSRILAGLGAALAIAAPAAAQVERLEGRSASGAAYVIERPANWNGTVLLYARGYSPTLREPPQTAPEALRPHLLDKGYALAASSYGAAGWALEEAVPAQLAALSAFEQRFGRPRRTIAFGHSMGGLVSLALAERHPRAVDAALPVCASISGAVPMLNQALDGAFAFKTLLAPGSDIRLVAVDDDLANAERVRRVLEAARATPQGRARVALAGVLAGLPAWSDPSRPEPAPDDWAAQQSQAAATFVMGVFLPRQDQEQRAGGVFSWNWGIDYQIQLARSGRERYVRALYDAAGLDLARDLAALNAAPRTGADPAAVAYMETNYSPTGRLSVPVLALQTIGDGLTPPNLQRAYEDKARAAGRGRMLASLYVRRAGHCTLSPAEQFAAIQAVEERLATGRWRATPGRLNARAAASGLGEAAFVAHRPAPFLRP